MLKGNLEREDYLEVPLSLEMSVQEAERFITETSNFGFDYNDPENLIAIFALALNDADESLTEEEFGSLHLYYKNLAKKKTQKLTYNELLKSPNAAANTKVNKDSVVNNFRSVAKERGKNVALQEMRDFLKKRFGRLNGVSLRATSLLQHVVECTQVTPTANAKPINDFLNDQRRTPYKGKEANEKASKMAKNISLLYTRPYTLTEADTDLLSKGRVHLSQYYCVDSNGKVEEQAPQSFDSLLRGKVKPTKADFLAALYRACITNWWDIGSVEAENIQKSSDIDDGMEWQVFSVLLDEDELNFVEEYITTVKTKDSEFSLHLSFCEDALFLIEGTIIQIVRLDEPGRSPTHLAVTKTMGLSGARFSSNVDPTLKGYLEQNGAVFEE